MKYWKQGFYDEPVDGSVEITDEYYNQLLAGQSAGLLINESKKGYPILIVHEVTVEEVRAQKLNELRLYDSSEAVNQFSIDNVSGWWNKATRVGLMNSIAIEKASGRTETNIWLDNTLFVLPSPDRRHHAAYRAGRRSLGRRGVLASALQPPP